MLGYIPDVPDGRDHWRDAAAPFAPARFSLRSKFPAPYNQGPLGSCVYNAMAGLLEYKHGVGTTPSRLFGYWNARYLDGTWQKDAGTSIRQGVKATVNWGWCPESEWPYDVARFAVQPSADCYSHARPHCITQYARISQGHAYIKGALLADDPVAFGFQVWEQYQKVGADGKVAMPAGKHLGGHANLIVGWDDAIECYEIRNSYGEGWGDHGYGWLPYDYVLNPQLASDFWTVLVSV
jgi:hypothetical protein